MQRMASMLVATAACAFVVSCEPPADVAESAPSAVRAEDGSMRLPFLGGAFVTFNQAMPIEVEQAVAGLPTKRPVIVWAGGDERTRHAPRSDPMMDASLAR